MPLVRLEITHQERFASGMEFGDVGSYELLHGIAHYEVDLSTLPIQRLLI